MSLTRLISLFFSPIAIGNVHTNAANKLDDFSVIFFGHFLPCLFPKRLKKHKVKWKIAAIEPKTAPNLGTSKRNFLIALVKLLVESNSRRNLIIAAPTKLRRKGGPVF